MPVSLPDFAAILSGERPYAEIAPSYSLQDLKALTDQIYDALEARVRDATDAAVTLLPHDPHLKDPATEQGWTLGHVIAHVTAGLEEGAAIASTLARGAVPEGRPRYEVPWESITTAAQVRQRLAESRRMVHGFLQTWPDVPHLDVAHTPIPRFGPLNAVSRILLALGHADGHFEQVDEILRQARRTAVA